MFLNPSLTGALDRIAERAADVLQRGDVVEVISNGQGAAVLAEQPDAQAALDRMRDLVALVRAGHSSEAVARVGDGDGERLVQSFREDVARMHTEEARLLASRRSAATLRASVAFSRPAIA